MIPVVSGAMLVTGTVLRGATAVLLAVPGPVMILVVNAVLTPTIVVDPIVSGTVTVLVTAALD